MPQRLTLDGMIAHFERMEAAASGLTHEAARLTAPVIAESIRTTIGDLNELTPLADSTIARKASAGYDQPEAPLIATGELRDSVTFAAVGNMATAGSDEMKAKWHEYGSSVGRYPPRPAFRIGLNKALPFTRLIAKGVVGAFLGKR